MGDDERHGGVHFGNGDLLLLAHWRQFLHDDVVDFDLDGREAESRAARMDAGTVHKGETDAFSVDERAGDVAADFKAVRPRGGGGLAVPLEGRRIDAPVEVLVLVDNGVGDFRRAVVADGHVGEDGLVLQMTQENARPACLVGGLQDRDVRLDGHVLSESRFRQKELRHSACDGMDELPVFDFPLLAFEQREAVQRSRLVEILLIDDFTMHGRGHVKGLCGEGDGEAKKK